MKYNVTFLLLSIFLFSCTKYRTPALKNNSEVELPEDGKIAFGSLRINEFICKGININAQQFFGGSDAKWFELYNPTNTSIVLTKDQWYITDSVDMYNKFSIPENPNGDQWTVPSKGFLAIMCLKSGTLPSPSRINATFSLNSTEGSIGIFYKQDSFSAVIAVDTISYSFPGGALSGISYGRLPDGQGPIIQLTRVSPETSN